MATLEIKDAKGKVVGKHELGAVIAGAEPLAHLLHQAVVTEEANARQGTQSARTRSETRGGGRKPYKQKKTGNARQGTIRAPHYAHGGMAFAVKPRDYTKKMNRKERRAAILGALQAQIQGGNVEVADKIAFAAPKTKDASAWLGALGIGDAKRILVILPAYDEVAFKSFRNIPSVTVRTAPSNDGGAKTVAFSTRDVLVAHKIVIAKDALAAVESIYAEDKAEAAPSKKEAKPKAAPKAKAELKAKAEPKAKAAPKAAAATEPKKTVRKKKSEEAEG